MHKMWNSKPIATVLIVLSATVFGFSRYSLFSSLCDIKTMAELFQSLLLFIALFVNV